MEIFLGLFPVDITPGKAKRVSAEPDVGFPLFQITSSRAPACIGGSDWGETK